MAELSAPNPVSIKWVNKSEGTFRFMDTVEVSRRWGQKKQKADMNFEKLSRGIRYLLKKYCYPFIKHTIQNLQQKKELLIIIIFFSIQTLLQEQVYDTYRRCPSGL